MKTKLIRAALTLLAFVAVWPAWSIEAEDRPTVAFVVGIQAYKDADLNKLQYPATDAREVFEQIRAVTNFDKTRSWLLLAERDAPEELERNNDLRMMRQRYLSAQQIRNELRLFLQSVNHDDNVIVYIGGHGTTGPDGSLLLAASDYDQSHKINDLPFANVIDDIHIWVDGRGLARIKIALFLNVCGAGNALSQGVETDRLDQAQDLNAAKKLSDQLQFGKSGFALFPATARNQDAFEDPGKRMHSVFAYYLLQGLSGRAAKSDLSGEITSRSLFEYIEKGINEYQIEQGRPMVRLPRNDNHFDDSMVLAVTRRQQGEAHYLVGTSLLAAAQEIASVSGGAGNRYELQSQKDLLSDLAISEFGEAIQRHPDLKQRARLRRAETRIWNGGAVASEALLRDLQALKSEDGLSDSEKSYAETLQSALKTGPATGTLRELHDYLAGGASFYSVLLVDDQLERECGEPWKRVLSNFPNQNKLGSYTMKSLIPFILDRPNNLDRPDLPGDLLATVRQGAASNSPHRSGGISAIAWPSLRGSEAP
jgi:uncharacterized caspase-like protein